MDAAPMQTVSHEDDDGSWQMVMRAPHTALTPHISRYCGYAEQSSQPVRRRELPHPGVVVILSFGPKIEVTSAGTGGMRTSFVAGLAEQHTITEYSGPQHGVQLDLTPLGAYRLLGLPNSELTNQVVDIDDFDRHDLRLLGERLANAQDWRARFAMLDRWLLEWADEGPEPDPAVVWAWKQLEGSHGQVPIAELAEEIGWSRRHFASKFRHQVGLPPKPAARVLRFGQSVEILTEARDLSITDVATAAGYSDHSHFTHEFRRFAGCTPSSYLASIDGPVYGATDPGD